MDPDLIEQAVRALELEPSHSLRADVLFSRLPQSLRRAVGLPQFIDVVRRRTDRFTVAAAPSIVEDGDIWTWDERVRYADVLADAGDATPIVTLPSTPADFLERTISRSDRTHGAVHDSAHGPGDLLADMHDALAHLLVSSAANGDMDEALACALDGLQVIADQLS